MSWPPNKKKEMYFNSRDCFYLCDQSASSPSQSFPFQKPIWGKACCYHQQSSGQWHHGGEIILFVLPETIAFTQCPSLPIWIPLWSVVLLWDIQLGAESYKLQGLLWRLGTSVSFSSSLCFPVAQGRFFSSFFCELSHPFSILDWFMEVCREA